jgi:iron complex transport system substrate-binding protein
MSYPRIVSLLPSATEILFAIGAGEQVVGVTHECDTPIEAASRPRVTSTRIQKVARNDESISMSIERQVQAHLNGGDSLYDLDEQRLHRLAPDVVVTQALCDICAVSFATVERAVSTLPNDPKLVSLEPSTLAEVQENVALLGRVAHRETEASALLSEMNERIAAVERRVHSLPRKRTVMLEWTDPPYGGGHWSSECVALAGGEPLCAFPGVPSEAISWDAVIAADPEVIIIAPCGTGLADTLAAIDDLASRAPFWLDFAAARRVVAIDGHHYVNRPSPALVRTIELFAYAIHPDGSVFVRDDEFAVISSELSRSRKAQILSTSSARTD